MFADRHQAVALEQQPAVTGRIRGAEAEHGKGGALRQRRAQPRKGFCRNQRRIAEHHQQIVGAARDRGTGGQHGMRGAEALGLNERRRIGADARHLVGDRLVVRPDHHRQRSACSVRGRVQHMRQQRLAGDGVQHLRQRGSHARALAGRKHDSQAGSSGHSIPQSLTQKAANEIGTFGWLVMPGLVPGIHVFTPIEQERRGWPGRQARRRASRFCPAMTESMGEQAFRPSLIVFPRRSNQFAAPKRSGFKWPALFLLMFAL